MRSLGVIAAAALFAVTPVAWGHDGEDHGKPLPPLSQSVAPRASAASDAFEMLLALEGKHLVVYLDRYASNEPVLHAKVEVEGAGLKGPAVEAAAGTYVMDLREALAPGRHALTISIDADNSADLLAATLEVAGPAVVEDWARELGKKIFWGIVALVIVVSGVRLVARYRSETA